MTLPAGHDPIANRRRIEYDTGGDGSLLTTMREPRLTRDASGNRIEERP